MNEKYKKYIIAFSFEKVYDTKLREFMDTVARITNMDALYHHMVPHITLHRPLVGIEYTKVSNLATSIALRLHKSRIRIGGIEHFGKKYIVLPVHATYVIASLWSGIHDLLSQVPEYEHGPFDHDNTLHITLAKDTEQVFDAVWDTIRQKVVFDSFDIPIGAVAIYGKNQVGNWDLIEEIPLPDK